jgi:hypothetical protein
LYGFGRHPYQRLLPRVSGADYKMPSMRLSLVMDCLSKATPEMVRLVEDSDKLPYVPVSRPTHDIATNQSPPGVRDQVQRATLEPLRPCQPGDRVAPQVIPSETAFESGDQPLAPGGQPE